MTQAFLQKPEYLFNQAQLRKGDFKLCEERVTKE